MGAPSQLTALTLPIATSPVSTVHSYSFRGIRYANHIPSCFVHSPDAARLTHSGIAQIISSHDYHCRFVQVDGERIERLWAAVRFIWLLLLIDLALTWPQSATAWLSSAVLADFVVRTRHVECTVYIVIPDD